MMKPAYSLERRLGLGLTLGIMALWLAATFIAGLVIRHELDEAFDSALQETAQRLLPLAAIDILGRGGDPAARRVSAFGTHEEFLTYLVRDRAGAVLLQSHDLDRAAFPERPAQGFRSTATHRIYGEAAVSGSIILEIAEPLAHRRTAAMEAMLALFLPLPVLVPLSLFGVWWFVRSGMRPVLHLKAEIEVRGGGDLSEVEVEGLPLEITPVATSLNQLMIRLRRVLEAERSFTANSAHELRTPIAAALAQTQRLIADCPAGALQDRALQIEVSLRKLAGLSEKLLQLARAEGGGVLAKTPQDLAPILAHVVDEFRQSDDGRQRLKFEGASAGALRARLEPDAFAVLMRNLLENAFKHGSAGTPVEVVWSGDNVIRVLSAGPIVPPARLARLKARFERGDTTATGSGLGLAIADVIASDAGARLDLSSPAGGRPDGFEARLTLPDGSGCTDADPAQPRP